VRRALLALLHGPCGGEARAQLMAPEAAYCKAVEGSLGGLVTPFSTGLLRCGVGDGSLDPFLSKRGLACKW
jgi:hypothetical protein